MGAPAGASSRSRPPARRRPAPAAARALLALLLVALVAPIAWRPGPAAAQSPSVTHQEAAALARQAATDDAALARLRAVRRVDGVPVDLRSVTADLGSARIERLDALARELAGGGAASGAGSSPDAARATATEVLDGSKYRAQQLPKPFKGLLEWLADRLRPVGRALDRAFGPVVDAILALPGGRFLLLALLAGAVALVTGWLVRRANRSAVRRSEGTPLVDLGLDPAELERLAGTAEAAGDWGLAVRYRYEAGLLRLVRADRLVLRADTTAAGAARQVDDPDMDALTRDFEEVVYGGRAATAVDVERARSGWLAVLAVGSRR